MKIKPDVYEAQRDQFAAGLARAKADLTKSELEFRRIETLFEKGLVSESEFVGARAGYESSKASYAQSVRRSIRRRRTFGRRRSCRRWTARSAS